jgi:hypothetical protein
MMSDIMLNVSVSHISHLWLVSLMLSVTYKKFIVNVTYSKCHCAECLSVTFMLGVTYAEGHYAECLSVTFMLGVTKAECQI